MKLCDVNPHVRFASKIHYASSGIPVKVADCRIFYTIDGEAKLQISNNQYVLRPKSLFFCCAGCDYIIKAPQGFDAISLNFDMTQEHNDLVVPIPTYTSQWDQITVFHDPVEDSSFLNSHLFLENAEELFPAISKILDNFSEQGPYFREHISCTLKKLLLLLHRDPQTILPPKIRLVKSYIDQNYAAEITNKDLARLAGYHEYYLNRLFLASTGTSLHSYLLKVRLNRASYLILNTDAPLKAIPELVGFHNYPHFSNYFKQHFGLSPADYRNNVQNSI